jgi:hypothetical protein
MFHLYLSDLKTVSCFYQVEKDLISTADSGGLLPLFGAQNTSTTLSNRGVKKRRFIVVGFISCSNDRDWRRWVDETGQYSAAYPDHDGVSRIRSDCLSPFRCELIL